MAYVPYPKFLLLINLVKHIRHFEHLLAFYAFSTLKSEIIEMTLH